MHKPRLENYHGIASICGLGHLGEFYVQGTLLLNHRLGGEVHNRVWEIDPSHSSWVVVGLGETQYRLSVSGNCLLYPNLGIHSFFRTKDSWLPFSTTENVVAPP
jgi:hypothetical protein